jgi:putative FmdB family regulatory protein
MPIYEYACAPCGKVFEELIVRRSDESEVRCPTCQGGAVTRVMSRPAQAGSGARGGPAPGGRCGPVG